MLLMTPLRGLMLLFSFKHFLFANRNVTSGADQKEVYREVFERSPRYNFCVNNATSFIKEIQTIFKY